MFLRSSLHLSVPALKRAALTKANSASRVVWPSDMAFHYPRYAIESHLIGSLPEVAATRKLIVEADASAESATHLGNRSREALRGANAVLRHAAAAYGAALPEAVQREMLAVSAAQAALEHVGRSQKRDAHAVAELAAAVRIVASRPGFLQADGAAFDNACMCVAGYTRAMLSAMKRGTWAATAAGVDFPTSSDALAAAAYLRECSQAVLAVNIHDAAVASTLRTSACAVSALNALLRVAHDGDAAVAASLLDGVVGGENDVRLALALTAELKNRVAAPLLGAEKISHEVEGLYQQASAAFEASFSPQTGEGAVQMPQGEAVAPREAYCSVLLSFAATYQDMPRAQPADRAFPESMRVSQSHVYIPPAAAVSAPSAITGIECPPVRARKVAVMCLDRALRINRKLYPEDRNNLKATALLRGLGCCYADAKDYIYATGMFNSALRAVEANFGRVSEEYLEVLRLQEHTQRRLKNDKEADATAHTITVLADDVSKIE